MIDVDGQSEQKPDCGTFAYRGSKTAQAYERTERIAWLVSAAIVLVAVALLALDRAGKIDVGWGDLRTVLRWVKDNFGRHGVFAFWMIVGLGALTLVVAIVQLIAKVVGYDLSESSIDIGPDGILYAANRSESMLVPWGKVDRIGSGGGHDALIVDDSVKIRRRNGWRPVKRIWISQFDQEWRRGEIGRLLRLHAPRLVGLPTVRNETTEPVDAHRPVFLFRDSPTYRHAQDVDWFARRFVGFLVVLAVGLGAALALGVLDRIGLDGQDLSRLWHSASGVTVAILAGISGLLFIIFAVYCVTHVVKSSRQPAMDDARIEFRRDGLVFAPNDFESILVRWDEVIGIRERSDWLTWGEGFELAAPVRLRLGLDRFMDVRAIPLRSFDPAWRTGEIGTALRRLAPRLVGPEVEEAIGSVRQLEPGR